LALEVVDLALEDLALLVGLGAAHQGARGGDAISIARFGVVDDRVEQLDCVRNGGDVHPTGLAEELLLYSRDGLLHGDALAPQVNGLLAYSDLASGFADGSSAR
jgi:hypothetical protein